MPSESLTNFSGKKFTTTVKINPSQLEGAPGLRMGIVPSSKGKTTQSKRTNQKLDNLPLRHDQYFMQIFYERWRVVQAFIAADANIPEEVSLPSPVESPHKPARAKIANVAERH
jgi:hypothetical protein